MICAYLGSHALGGRAPAALLLEGSQSDLVSRSPEEEANCVRLAHFGEDAPLGVSGHCNFSTLEDLQFPSLLTTPNLIFSYLTRYTLVLPPLTSTAMLALSEDIQFIASNSHSHFS